MPHWKSTDRRDYNETGYHAGSSPEGHQVNAHEITAPGVIYKDANVTVTAFATKHAMVSYGYRFDTPDRSVVISGDTSPTQAAIDDRGPFGNPIADVRLQRREVEGLMHEMSASLANLATVSIGAVWFLESCWICS